MSVKLTDQDVDGKLENYSYEDCNDNSDDIIKNSRGLIYKNNIPFVKAFGYTPVYTTKTIDEDTINSLNTNIRTLRCFYSLEGTLLRLYYNDINDKWYISTHNKIDATKSRWGSKYTYGQLFKNAIPPNFYENLDKSYVYMLILTPNEDNRIVCNTFLNNLFHVATYDSSFNISYDFNINIQKPPEIHVASYEELVSIVDDNSFSCNTYQGIIVCNPETQSNIKIYNETYNKLKDVRGNTSSIMFRYLQLRTSPEMSNLSTLFPDFVSKFLDYEIYIELICKKLFNLYMNRYIHKQYTQLPPPEHHIIKLAHAWHKEDKLNNKMSIEKITEIVDKQDAPVINSLIKLNK
jgi:hypothetical protein